MGPYLDIRHNGSVIRYGSDLLNPMEPRLFDVSWLKAKGYHQGTSAGRGEAHFLRFANRDMVLRPFRRGGLVGKINKALYLRAPLEKTRSMQEFGLLSWMRAQQLLVPRPLAAQVTTTGPFYRAALLMERIPKVRPLEERLWEARLDKQGWLKVGGAIRRMHNAGVFHSDLNCRNILIDADSHVWLIDFDKCERRAKGPWTLANLNRLERSLLKSARLIQDFNWRPDDWTHLLSGYSGETEAQ